MTSTSPQDDVPRPAYADGPDGPPAEPGATPERPDGWTEEPGRAGPAERPMRGFKGWRRRRPFWGGLLVLLGGGEILLSERASISVVLHAGADSLAGYLLPAVMAVCGLLILFNPMHRIFYSVISVLCSLATWVTSNLGGFFIGMLFGLIGSSLAFGWLPDQEPRRWRRRRAEKNADTGADTDADRAAAGAG